MWSYLSLSVLLPPFLPLCVRVLYPHLIPPPHPQPHPPPGDRVSIYIPRKDKEPQQWTSGGTGYMCVRFNRPSWKRPYHFKFQVFMKALGFWKSFSRPRHCEVDYFVNLAKIMQDIDHVVKNLVDGVDEEGRREVSGGGGIGIGAGDLMMDSMDQYAALSYGTIQQGSAAAAIKNPLDLQDPKQQQHSPAEQADLFLYAISCAHHFQQDHIRAQFPTSTMEHITLVRFRLPEHRGNGPMRYQVVLRFFNRWYRTLVWGRRLAVVKRAQDDVGQRTVDFTVGPRPALPKPPKSGGKWGWSKNANKKTTPGQDVTLEDVPVDDNNNDNGNGNGNDDQQEELAALLNADDRLPERIPSRETPRRQGMMVASPPFSSSRPTMSSPPPPLPYVRRPIRPSSESRLTMSPQMPRRPIRPSTIASPIPPPSMVDDDGEDRQQQLSQPQQPLLQPYLPALHRVSDMESLYQDALEEPSTPMRRTPVVHDQVLGGSGGADGDINAADLLAQDGELEEERRDAERRRQQRQQQQQQEETPAERKARLKEEARMERERMLAEKQLLKQQAADEAKRKKEEAIQQKLRQKEEAAQKKREAEEKRRRDEERQRYFEEIRF